MNKNTIFIKDGKKNVKLYVQEIQFIKSNKNYLEIYLNQTMHKVRAQLEQFANSLPSEYFVRVHRRYLVNIFVIDQFDSNSISTKHAEIPISKTYRKEFLDMVSRIAKYPT